jgi:hypothetical protein
MTTATGDIALNAAGLANVNPFTDPLITTIGVGIKVFSGRFTYAASGNAGFLSVVEPSGTIYSSTTEYGAQTGDRAGPVLLNSSFQGYVYAQNYGQGWIYKQSALGTRVQLVSSGSVGNAVGDLIELEFNESTSTVRALKNGVQVLSVVDSTSPYATLRAGIMVENGNAANGGVISWAATGYVAGPAGPDYTQRKSSSFDVTHTLGTITTATLNAGAITINTTGAGTANLTDTSGITTSGEYNLVLGDGTAIETYTVQLNVYGVVPSNNPAQKDGSALASLTGVQIRITAGANLNGTQVYYSGTETTNASGNFSTLDVSTSAAVAADPVRMQVLTAAGDSITSAETVELI